MNFINDAIKKYSGNFKNIMLMVLALCNSEQMGRNFYEAGVKNVILTKTALENDVASAFNKTLYHRISNGTDIRDAILETANI